MADSSQPSSQALLRRAAERAAADPFFLASALLPYARAEGWDDTSLAERLGCQPSDLPRLLLCRRPRPDSQSFRADLARIGETFGLKPTALAELLRLADALSTLRTADQTQIEGWLAAARDRPAEDGKDDHA
jgi:hypothetical protein